MDMQPFWSLGVPTVGTLTLPVINSDFTPGKVPLYDVQTSSVYIYNVTRLAKVTVPIGRNLHNTGRHRYEDGASLSCLRCHPLRSRAA